MEGKKLTPGGENPTHCFLKPADRWYYRPMMSKYLLFFLGIGLFFTGCEGEDTPPSAGTSPAPLSLGQLVDLKKTAEALEGLFMTTALSDDKAYSKSGKYIYVCVRFLNDPKVNQTINRQGLPLLVQVSDRQVGPKGGAEAVFVLKPRTKKQLVYRDKKDLKLNESFIQLSKKSYRIWNVVFNSGNKLDRVTLAPRDLPVNKILKAEARHLQRFTDEEFDLSEESEDDSEDSEGDESDPLLQLKVVDHFAPMSSRSCQYWTLSHYTHSSETPSYLQVKYQHTKSTSTSSSSSPSQPTSPVSTTPLPENKPHTRVPQNN